MKDGYLPTFVAAIIIIIINPTLLASNLLRVGTLGPAALGRRARLKSAWRALIRRLKDLVNDLVAAMLARRERQAAMVSLRQMTDRGLRDIGLCRGGTDHIARGSERDRRPSRCRRPSIACVVREGLR